MISRKMLITMYEYSYFLTSQGIKGLIHQQSLVKPPGGDNPANWILGHIITSRCNVLALLKIEPPWSFERCQPYLPDSRPQGTGDDAEDFQEMKRILDQTQASLLDTIKNKTEAQLGGTSGENTIGEELAGYAIHEAYHAGELEIIKGMIQSI